MSVKNQVRRHLESGGKISPLAALRDFGCLRLAAVIYELRKEGMEIVTDTRTQRGKHFAVYRLDKAQAER
jgi:hypothetical protein